MTVDAYKTNNILSVEVTSRDVAALAAELCGPVFAKTTGAQIPVDGGNDRVVSPAGVARNVNRIVSKPDTD